MIAWAAGSVGRVSVPMLRSEHRQACCSALSMRLPETRAGK